MNQYKLSYYVGHYKDKVSKIATSELELAENILDMERDVGFLCHGVTVEQGDFDESLDRKSKNDNLQLLKNIQRWAKVLMTAPHLVKIKGK